MGAMASQITDISMVCSAVFFFFQAQVKENIQAPVTGLCEGIRWPWIPPHKGPVLRKMFPFDDVTM